MKDRTLGELMTAYDELRSLVESAAVADQAAFDDLASTLRAHLSRRLARVTSTVGEAQAREMWLPLVFWLDEQVQRRWSCLGFDWPLLQQIEFGRCDGGDAFFEEAARLLQSESPEPLVIATYLLALREGFEGCYGEQPERLHGIRTQLVSCLPAQQWDLHTSHHERLPRAKPAWLVWSPLVAVPLLVQLLLAWAAAIW